MKWRINDDDEIAIYINAAQAAELASGLRLKRMSIANTAGVVDAGRVERLVFMINALEASIPAQAEAIQTTRQIEAERAAAEAAWPADAQWVPCPVCTDQFLHTPPDCSGCHGEAGYFIHSGSGVKMDPQPGKGGE